MRNKKKDVNIIAIGKVWRKKNKKIGGERRMTQEDIVILSQLLDQKFEPVYTRLDLLESDVRELKSGMSENKTESSQCGTESNGTGSESSQAWNRK